MSLFSKIRGILDEIDYACYMEYLEGVDWCYHCDEPETVYYIVNGELYSGEITEGAHQQGDCTFINTDTGCGDTVTQVFLTENKMSWDDFYDKYEDII